MSIVLNNGKKIFDFYNAHNFRTRFGKLRTLDTKNLTIVIRIGKLMKEKP
jgi:hypothetical protein